MPLAGEGAWVSAHGVERAVLEGHAAATRGLIVRSWRAVLGGKPAAPHLATFCTEWGKNNHRTAVELAPPPGISELQPGDFVEAELELVISPPMPPLTTDRMRSCVTCSPAMPTHGVLCIARRKATR